MLLRGSEERGSVLNRTDRDERIQDLVEDFWRGHLTRRGFLAKAGALGLTAATAVGLLGTPRAQEVALAQETSPDVQPKQWKKGEGWGWGWGDDDHLGNLNE